MKKALLLLLSLVLTLSLFTAPAVKAQGVVNVFNWEDYIDEEVLKLFTQETGIGVNYIKFTDNEGMLVQVGIDPSKFDVVFPSDYAIERLVAQDMLQELDFSKIPNAEHTLDWMKGPAYDPDNKYSIPYMWGTVGILYDTTRVTGPIDSWGVLFDGSYKGEIFMLDSMRDSLGIAMKYLGHSMNSRNPLELAAAAELLIKQKQDGLVKAYQLDETKDKMVAGEAILAVVYSGDAQYAISKNDKLAYVVPKEGSNVWVDGMVVPKDAQNPENAMAFINFLSRPDIAVMNTEYIEYSTPNKEAIELLGEGYKDNPTINPPQDVVDRCEFFNDIYDSLTIYTSLWDRVKNAR